MPLVSEVAGSIASHLYFEGKTYLSGRIALEVAACMGFSCPKYELMAAVLAVLRCSCTQSHSTTGSRSYQYQYAGETT